MNYELVEMTGSNPEDNDFCKVVWDEEDKEFYTAYFENGYWKSNDTQDGWFNRPLKNVIRWFEIRPTKQQRTGGTVAPLTRLPACKTCEYNPCDIANNSDYCPARK